ncbi:multiple epidermal growth factor-like domains protein 11 [Lingula anatina]|uniref:Multiple epidermal growth factor-like domains protein 11 n=1 Tax=Lingula anatina TaxID=7574 RepID=A0A2R2MPQ2_LINAN|nr:multiple epidermal growth factor-like domains protein 11 [Lingula anatina]|eukprot:XP_023932215.1 multiple epidermal growth factor-like domains protein 11 [Lingula anatina]
MTCPAGYSCATTVSSPLPCPLGTYSIGGQTACTSCPAGSACPSATNVSSIYICPVGTYSLPDSPDCTVCPSGKYCPSITEDTVLDCPYGTFSHSGQAVCMSCPAGWQCPALDGTQNSECVPGFFSIGNQTACTQCSAGFACPSTTSNQTFACHPGTYAVAGSTSCTLCIPGYECPRVDSAERLPCNSGYFSIGSQAACDACPAGYACDSSLNRTQCPVGTYSLLGASMCTPCEAGRKCPFTNQTSEECENGTYSLGSQVECTPCPAGSYCAQKDIPPLICQMGTYSSTSVMECSPCSPGYMCGINRTSSEPPQDICPIGSYCPDGKISILCPKSTYGNMTGASNITYCLPCVAGWICKVGTRGHPGTPGSNAQLCYEGHYCPEGAEYQGCPKGMWSPNKGNTDPEDCDLCPGGMLCEKKGIFRPYFVCPDSYYCPPGSHTPTKCPPGRDTRGGASHIDHCLPTEKGFFSTGQGTERRAPCHPGHWGNVTGMQTHELACTLCPPGKVCDGLALTEPGRDCELGYYCLEGTVSPTQYPCPPGTLGNATGLVSVSGCLICPAGFACTGATGSPLVEMLICAKGHYCPNGTVSDVQFPCPGGTYNSYTGMSQLSDCKTCPAGQLCPPGTYEIVEAYSMCDRGHYCPAGTNQSVPCPGGTYNPDEGSIAVTFCRGCPIGHYCPAGSVDPTPCEPGTMNPNVNQSRESSACLPCTAGQVCTAYGLTEPDGPCQAGFFCPEGTAMANETVCPAGTYTDRDNLTSADECDICPASFACLEGTGGFKLRPRPCSKGLLLQERVMETMGGMLPWILLS